MQSAFRILFLISFFFYISSAFGATYYVSPSGKDSNSGAEASPWLTLQYASNKVIAGDTVIVQPGSYAGFVAGWDFMNNGTASAPITFHGMPGAKITSRNSKTMDGINLEGVSYWIIEGFEVIGIPRAGIRSVQNHNVIIRNNVLNNNTIWGILTGFSDDVLIEGNTTSNSQQQHGIYVSNSGDRPIIRNNISFGNKGCGIHMNGDASQGGDGVISNALVEQNIIYNNGTGGCAGINADGVSNSIFRNNLLYNNHSTGIVMFQDGGGTPSINNLIINNTVVQASDARWAMQIVNGSTGNKVLNNIFWNSHSFRGSFDIDTASLPGLISDYNVVMDRFSLDAGDTVISLANWQKSTKQDTHSLVSQPSLLFVSPAQNDYHLSNTSPARNIGTVTSAPAIDLAGVSRPQGDGFDIGAYEYKEGDVTPPSITPAPAAPERLRLTSQNS